MKRLLISAIALIISYNAVLAKEAYKRSDLPVEERVADLLQRMTLTEKIGQLRSPMGWEMYDKQGDEVTISAKYKELMAEMPIGSFWAVLRADPWTQRDFETGVTPQQGAMALNALQRYAVEHTRLGIPILFAEECPHGHMALGTTIFPTSLCQASTWNEALIRRMGEVIALEARSQGANIGYGPVLDIARDPRWSRMEETYGEDPTLTAILGTAFVQGMQGTDPSDGRHLYSTLKHFTAYGVPESGHNGARANTGLRQLFSEYMPPFRHAVLNGAASIMTSYNAIDGVPCTANRYLLTDILREEWGFRGVIYSDLFSIEGIAGMRVAEDMPHAAALALKSGVDMDLGGAAYGNNLQSALQQGLITMEDIDRAVANVLRMKFNMGLFENPYVNPQLTATRVRTPEHKALAKEVARQGTVLLKNDGILPLSKSLNSIAVIGPNADMIYNQLGDYTSPQQRHEITTVLDGIHHAVSSSTEVIYAKGCSIRDTTQTDIASAVEAARRADVAIVVVGGSSARDFNTKYINTGAATTATNASATISDMECGEGFDRCSLELLGDQKQLLSAVAATATPMVVVYIEGRPLDMRYATDHANALLTAWYPGEQGGDAIAEILFGDYNPAGRLPVSIPRSVGQVPIYYSKGNFSDYVEGEGSPLYPFGYGLSYTTFKYDDMKVKQTGKASWQVSCCITNTGERNGDEVVQLYLTDDVASVVQPPLLLKGFQRITLNAGESRVVTFTIGEEELAIYDFSLNHVVEPGTFTIRLGASSADIRLQQQITQPPMQ
jgi:beta-glucosidase